MSMGNCNIVRGNLSICCRDVTVWMSWEILLSDLWNMRIHAVCTATQSTNTHTHNRYALNTHVGHTHFELYLPGTGSTYMSKCITSISLVNHSYIGFKAYTVIYPLCVHYTQGLSLLCLLNNLKFHIISSFILPIWEKQLCQLANQIFQGC